MLRLELISVILYGRNDSYGYNLHKRAAISLNCIAEVLTDPEDEIIFVDCNTPDDMPTFPKAIQDTLTPKARKLLRILRLRPHLYNKYKKGSPLKALEPLSRNIAIRRSNPSNRWILSTNTDMVFVTRYPEKSLSDVVADLPDGFYELPRFEVPESLWESVNRLDPASIISLFKKWGQRLHLNEVIIARPFILFDGPGDFQLMLRKQIFKINGFNEDMVWGWHADSNICKRLYILNGGTKSLLDHVFAYHCDHTRQSTFLHNVHQRTMNDEKCFVYNVSSPFLPHQEETWGIPNEEIEEISLTDEYFMQFINILESLLPGLSESTILDIFTPESYNHGQIYDNLHILPFLSDHLTNISPLSDIGYFGGNVELLQLISKFLSEHGHKRRLLVNQELITTTYPNSTPLPDRCLPLDDKSIIEQSNIFIFDVAMMQFPKIINENGISFPKPSREIDDFIEKLKTSFRRCAESEVRQLHSAEKIPRKFLLISSQNTWFEGFASAFISTILTPYSTHVRHGYIQPYGLIDSSSFKWKIIDFGLTHREKIKKVPLLRDFAKLIYKKISIPKDKKKTKKCPRCGARIIDIST